ncbi:glycoside hydrolase family 3 protein [Paenibacillus sp. JNUCC31]|uniref:glycoside hydrolase family 3 protein n=1 Tax=Paenibacillus sp. JNUCC-31 TaxID=2777983 RepID=UPI001E636451|nr:glycoside hydrolase family 3 protein [Paenibacillus sp. JNUCC-31]
MMEPKEITIQTLPSKKPVPSYEQHEQISLEVAREGIILLKNEENLLPIKKEEMLNVFGIGQSQFRLGALGAGKINPRYQVRFLRAIEEYSDFSLNEAVSKLYQSDEEVCPSVEILEQAFNESQTAIIVISRASGENIDNNPIPGEYYLSADEEAMIQAVSGKFDKTIAIVNSGYPIDVRWVKRYNIKGLIVCGFVGMLGGKALVEILDGRVNPSAKLPDTWSLDYEDIPSSRNFYTAMEGKAILDSHTPYFVDTYYEEDIYVGYRYFETFNKQVAYPFGYGLSYTTFSLQPCHFTWENNVVKLSVEITNTGSVTGKEVVQIYVEEPDGLLEKPSRKLVGFSKTQDLRPGSNQILTFQINRDQLASYSTDSASWIMESGTYLFYAGTSIKHLLKAGSFELEEMSTIRTVSNKMSPPVSIRVLSKRNPEETYPTGEFSGIKSRATELTPIVNRQRMTETQPIQADLPTMMIKYTDVVVNPELLDAFIKQLTVEELARLSVCNAAGWGMTDIGEAGRLYLLEKYDMRDFIVADGNSGVNVNKPNIGMPSSTVLCSSFNTQLAYEVGKVIAEEAIENNIHLILAPGMNIHRNPLNGRHPEYFSEDPFLTGIMAGYQSKGLEENGVSSCLKHTVANNCESARKRNHSLMTERSLREIYLKAFEVAIRVHKPDSIMTAYNACNGVFTAADEEMIQGVFREEFGFEGYVMTDWDSYETVDVVEAVAAGNCWLTPGTPDNTYVTPIIEGVREGRIEKARLEKNVKHLLSVTLKRTKI